MREVLEPISSIIENAEPEYADKVPLNMFFFKKRPRTTFGLRVAGSCICATVSPLAFRRDVYTNHRPHIYPVRDGGNFW